MSVQGGKGVDQANPVRVSPSAEHDARSPMNLRFQEKLLGLIMQEPVP